jgi:hypothetical protein
LGGWLIQTPEITLNNEPAVSWSVIGASLTLRNSKPRRRLTLSENIVSPLVRYACDLNDEGPSGILLSRNTRQAVRASLRRRLAFPAASVVQFEWELFSNNLRPTAKSNVAKRLTDPYDLYFANGVERITLALAELYPELRRIWCVQIRNWLAFFSTFQRHAARFAERMNFGDSVRIVRLRPDISDPHKGNRTVIRATFKPGGDWIYKPRCAGQDRIWFELLSLINRAGFSHPFRIPQLISAERHHWMETIRTHPCATSQQERDFWFRCGALLYLVATLRGVDFHAGNLVCAKEQPVFVDCETLGHPETAMPRNAATRERGLFRTGMLPLKRVPLRNTAAALGLITIERVSPTGLRAADRAKIVAAGFESIHLFVMLIFGRVAPLARARNQIQRRQSRRLYRPTAAYHFILQHSLSVSLLRNPAIRSEFLQKACCALHVPQHISRREAAALGDLDIPYFVGSAAATSKPPTAVSVMRAVSEIINALRRRVRPVAAAVKVPRNEKSGIW